MIQFLSAGDIITYEGFYAGSFYSEGKITIKEIKTITTGVENEYIITPTINNPLISYKDEKWFILTNTGWRELTDVKCFKQLDTQFIRDIKLNKLI